MDNIIDIPDRLKTRESVENFQKEYMSMPLPLNEQTPLEEVQPDGTCEKPNQWDYNEAEMDIILKMNNLKIKARK